MPKWIFLIFITQSFCAFSNKFESYDFMNGLWKCVATIELNEEIIIQYKGETRTSVKELTSTSSSILTIYYRDNRNLYSEFYVESTEKMTFDQDIMSTYGLKIKKIKATKDDLLILTPEFFDEFNSTEKEISKSRIHKLDNNYHTHTSIEDGSIMSCSRLKSLY